MDAIKMTEVYKMHGLDHSGVFKLMPYKFDYVCPYAIVNIVQWKTHSLESRLLRDASIIDSFSLSATVSFGPIG